MKRILLSGLLITIALNLLCQITITRSDVYDLGDEIPRIYYAFEQEGESYNVDSVILDPLVFDDLDFPYVEIDTLVYQSSSETDLEGIYEGSTCSYYTRDGFVMHLLITDEQMSLVGFQGQLPMTGDPMNLVFTDTLVLNTFPYEFESQHQDIGSAYENQHISVFESIIPAEYYSTFTAIYDTVRFLMDLEIKVQYDQSGQMQYVGDSNLNGTYDYLRENRKLINVFDIQLRSKLSGDYTSLSEIPAISDQLPMDIPMIDTTSTYAYWTNNQKSPLAEIELNPSYDSVYSVTFRYAYLSSVPQFAAIVHQVYPNPTEDFIMVDIAEYKNSSFEIFTIQGKKVKEIVLFSQNSKIDISSLPGGNYIYRIKNKNNLPVAGGKFIKN
jgi:hypothetical protein